MARRPIRVLQVMEATIGGTKRHLLDLAAASDRSSFHFEVACPRVRSEPRGDTSFFDDMSALDVQLHVVPMTRAIRPIDDWRATWALVRLIHRGRYDIVHTHSTKAGVVGRVAAMLAPGARIVHTPHGFYFLNFASPIARAPLRWLEAMLGRATSALIALSEGERQVAGEIVQPRKVRKVPLTFAPFEPLPRAEARRRLGLPADAPIVGTTARFTEQKAPFDIAETFAAIYRRRPDARFLWTNDGELRTQVEDRLRELDVHKATSLPGFVTNARTLLTALDVYLHMARWEGVPYSIMEVMTAGVPIVAARAVGTTDLIEHERTGLLVKPGDIPAAAAATLRLLTHSDEARTLATEAHAAVAVYHDAEAMARATELVYRELVRER
ncbi:MAG: glycosyltransferase [Chloroflexota bacterium]|nr:glycosyltransferase [Chloroflexota bacterium]MDE2896766.1 glycosyltransferase [Chloroflexota bacterium]